MKDKAMLSFYRSQTSMGDTAAAWAAWTLWCAEHGEQPGSLADFIARVGAAQWGRGSNHHQRPSTATGGGGGARNPKLYTALCTLRRVNFEDM